MRHFRTQLALSFALVWAFALASATPAWAKKVTLAWKPIKGAIQYELVIEKEGKNVVKQTFDETTWKGELPPGVYLYQVRGYDRVKRPGEWSAARPVVVMPPAPEMDEPGKGGKVTLYDSSAATPLKWKETPGIAKYVVQVYSEGKPIRKEVVTSPKVSLKGLSPGAYKWSVTPVIEAPSGGRAPASIASRQWEGKPSEPAEFVIQRKELGAPVPVEPVGTVEPSSDGILKFKWNSVEGHGSRAGERRQVISTRGQERQRGQDPRGPRRSLQLARARAGQRRSGHAEAGRGGARIHGRLQA